MIRLSKKLDTYGAIFKDEITANKTIILGELNKKKDQKNGFIGSLAGAKEDRGAIRIQVDV